jgi:TonB-linked SusC/RagA family outer membrane protein
MRLTKTLFHVSLTAIAFLFTTAAFSQNRTITGKVTDASSGQGVLGSTVSLKGSKVATQTDNQGSFSISVPNSAKSLIISSVGYESREIPIDGRSEISASLQITNSRLNDVVVVGYGTQKRKDLTGAVSSIGAATIAKVPVVSAEQALQGRAAGVQVTSNDAAPGGNITVLIRGTGSLASYGNSPLYVVDGYPLSTGINNINPSDIASIDVLKDASATAIYGIRAANGVVIITTKKGRKDGVQVSLDAYSAFQSKPKEYDLLNAQQWGTLAVDVANADSLHNFIIPNIWRTPSQLTNVDWQNALYRSGLTQNYSIGVRGGNDKLQSALSVGYYDQKGIVLGSYFDRLVLGLNMDYTPTKWLRSSTSAKYTYQKSNVPFGTGYNGLMQLAILPPTLDSGNKFTSQIKDANGNYGFYNPNVTFVAKFGNPVYSLETNKYSNITNYLLATSSLEITIVNGLKIKTNAGINTSYYTGSYDQPQDERLDMQYNLGGPTTKPFYSFHQNNTFEWLWENTLSYDKTFGLHTINFVGGVSAQENTNTLEGVSGIPPNTIIRDIAQLSNLQYDANGNGQTITSLASEFARLNYNFGDKYIVTGTIRRDGSSKFDTGHKYGTFPSGAIAWRVKQEPFMEKATWLSDLKLRGSYGEVGNQGSIAPFGYEALYSTGLSAASAPGTVNGIPISNLGYPFNKIYQQGYAQTQPANPKLKWETDYLTDIGLDAAFLEGHLNLTVDWYKRRSKDFLLTLAAPAQTGYNFLTRNVGSMENTGLEFALNYNNSIKGVFQYGVALTLTTNKNTLTSITSGTNYVSNFGGLSLTGIGWNEFSRSYVGGPVGEFYGYKTLGIFQSQAQINALNAAATAKNPANMYYQKPTNKPGDRYFADTNGDGVVNASDVVALGSPQPKFFGGLNLDGTYKAWDFNLYFYGVYGNKIDNYTESALESFQNRGFTGVDNVSEKYYNNRWTPTNPSNRYAKASYNDDAIGDDVPSSTWIEDGSFLKLKNATIGYTIQSNFLKKAMISKVRLYVSSQNLFTITKYTGLDPEIGLQNGNATQNGLDNGAYPSSRYYTVGLNVIF